MLFVAEVWRCPRLVLEQASGLGVLGAVAWWWLGLGESIGQLVLAAAVGLTVLAGLAGITRRAWVMLGTRESPRSVIAILLGVILLALVGFASYRLVWWVPGIGSFTGQLASMVIRFLVAYLLVLTGWLNLIAAVSGGKPRASQETTSAVP